jgi:hypothetical protein
MIQLNSNLCTVQFVKREGNRLLRYHKSIIHFIKGIKAQSTAIASGGIRAKISETS